MFKSLVVLFTISSMCWLKESLELHQDICQNTLSRTMEFSESELSRLRMLLLWFVVGA